VKTKWQLSMAIALIPLFVSSVISCSTPAPIPEPPIIEVQLITPLISLNYSLGITRRLKRNSSVYMIYPHQILPCNRLV